MYDKELKKIVDREDVKTILEVGGRNDWLRKALGAESDAEKSRKSYDLVYSSGLIQHEKDKVSLISAMMLLSSKYVLNVAPNSGCRAYMNAKAKTKAAWKDEADFTQEELAQLHEDAGLKVVETGFAGAEWAKRFGLEPSEPYLVYCLAEKIPKKKLKKEEEKVENVKSEEIPFCEEGMDRQTTLEESAE